MEKYTILDPAGAASAVAPERESESRSEPARRDLEAALQLLAERAHYVTGASGASIALRESGGMVCHAGAGRSAAETGKEIETDSGLTAESIRTGQLVRCDDADNDPRVNRQRCHELGIKSVMVIPLLREREVAGLFELVADRKSAFEESDAAALLRLAEMALTALEHAEAAQRALPEISEAEISAAEPGRTSHTETAAAATVEPIHDDEPLPSTEAEPLQAGLAEMAKVGSCSACGFPVSQGRTLCVECEQAGRLAENRPPLDALDPEESWWQAHSYTVGTLLIAALTIALLILKMR